MEPRAFACQANTMGPTASPVFRLPLCAGQARRQTAAASTRGAINQGNHSQSKCLAKKVVGTLVQKRIGRESPQRAQYPSLQVGAPFFYIMYLANCLYFSSELAFRFGRKVIRLATDGVFASTLSSQTAPTLAYLDLSTLELRREKSVQIPNLSDNPPVYRLGRVRQRRLRPANDLEDPYIAAVLIGLAQEQRQQQDTAARPKEEAEAGPLKLPLPATQRTEEATTCFKVSDSNPICQLIHN
jgi:hypothetical protein